jgi:hypothetical protein
MVVIKMKIGEIMSKNKKRNLELLDDNEALELLDGSEETDEDLYKELLDINGIYMYNDVALQVLSLGHLYNNGKSVVITKEIATNKVIVVDFTEYEKYFELVVGSQNIKNIKVINEL